MIDLFHEEYGDVIELAREGERRCLEGRRWGGNAVLIVVDAALDSIGLNYFQIVVPRVQRFWKEHLRTGEIASFKDFARLSPEDPRLRSIMNNGRCWKVAVNVCGFLDKTRTEEMLPSDFAALRFWAENAKTEEWRQDPIGAISGVGLITFQYLRMQAGIDTTMPDKIIKRTVGQVFGIRERNDQDFIRKMELLSQEIGYSQTLLCWAIWLKESDLKTSSWEQVD